jgi:hypothetical protein
VTAWATNWIVAAASLALLLVSAFMQARRGIGRWSFVPWDYAMILFAIVLMASLAHAALLWRDGWGP